MKGNLEKTPGPLSFLAACYKVSENFHFKLAFKFCTARPEWLRGLSDVLCPGRRGEVFIYVGTCAQGAASLEWKGGAAWKNVRHSGRIVRTASGSLLAN